MFAIIWSVLSNDNARTRTKLKPLAHFFYSGFIPTYVTVPVTLVSCMRVVGEVNFQEK